MNPAKLFLLLALSACSLSAAAGNSKPNIIIILADDMGHGFVSSLYPNSKIQTPNIDRLVKRLGALLEKYQRENHSRF